MLETIAITIGSDNFAVDKEAVNALKQWEQDGTVTAKYVEKVLGDISQGISVTASVHCNSGGRCTGYSLVDKGVLNRNSNNGHKR